MRDGDFDEVGPQIARSQTVTSEDGAATVSVEPRFFRVIHGGVTLVQTTCALRLEGGEDGPVYFAPRCDVDMSALEARETRDSALGRVRLYAVRIGGVLIEDAAYEIEAPEGPLGRLERHIAFSPSKLDTVCLARIQVE